jgi:murein DD-endopeptidase MepM/ murein hydrolase activator NlpD
MKNWGNRLTALSGAMKAKVNKGKKSAVAVTAAAVLAAAGTHPAAAKDEQLTTVYYVYIDGDYAGTVLDKDIIQSKVEQQVGKAQESYEYELSAEADITYIPEQVFNTDIKTEENQVLEQVSEVGVSTEAAGIMIDGKPAVYLETIEKAQEVLEKFKLQYASEKELEELEAYKKAEESKETLPPLEKNEERLTKAAMAEEVSAEEMKADPKLVLSEEEALKLLNKGTLEEKKYTVQEGDVLGKIAAKHDLDLEKLLALNPGMKEGDIVKVGQEVNVTVLEPMIHAVVEKEVYKKEKVAFEKEVIEDSSMFKGDTKVKQKGKDGVKGVTYKITEQNGVPVQKAAVSEKMLEEPVKEIVIKGTKVIPSRGDGSFAWPADGGYISSKLGYRWGKMHKGIDIARPSTRTISAADNGKVVTAGNSGDGYGNKVIIDHQNGYRTLYAHLASIDVSVGETVPKGTKIGVMGSTGDSTGTHLHFEVYKNGSLQDPLKYVNR